MRIRQIEYNKSRIAEMYWQSKGFAAKYGKGHYIDVYFWYKLVWYLSDYCALDGYSEDTITILAQADKTDYDYEVIIMDALKEYDVMQEEEIFCADIWNDSWKVRKIGAAENEVLLDSLRRDAQFASIALCILEDMDEKISDLTNIDEITGKDTLRFVSSEGRKFRISIEEEE